MNEQASEASSIQEYQVGVGDEVLINPHNLFGVKGGKDSHSVVQLCSSSRGVVIDTEGQKATARCMGKIEVNMGTEDEPNIEKIDCGVTQTVSISQHRKLQPKHSS